MPTTYLSKSEVEADEANDPLLHSVRLLHQTGALDPQQALKIYQDTCEQVNGIAAEVTHRPHLQSASEVAASLIPPKRICTPANGPSAAAREQAFGNDLRAMADPQPMSRLINWALTDLMLQHSEVVMMGEDIGRKGGVYGVT